MTIKARAAHTSRAVTDGYELGLVAHCAGCSATVRGVIAWGADHAAALDHANAILDAEARDRGWRCLASGDTCDRCKRR
jgi:hypothetical protein